MQIKTFKEVCALLPKDISVMARGRHGIGKSQCIYQLAEDVFKLPVLERRLGQLTEGDLVGLPFNENDRSTKFLPPDWFADAMEKPHVIFLDELDRSTKQVQQAGMELVLDRSIQMKKIHEDCRIFSAINGGKHGSNYKVMKLDPALNDRFWIADIEPSIREWLNWGEENNNIIPIIRKFISIHEVHLEKKEPPRESHLITPSRRAWKMLSDTMKENPGLQKKEYIFKSICFGFIGTDATSRFIDFVKKEGKSVTAKDIIDNFQEVKSKIEEMHISEKSYLVGAVGEQNKKPWSKEQMKNVYDFFLELNQEMKVTLYEEITNRTNNNANSRSFATMVQPILKDVYSSG